MQPSMTHLASAGELVAAKRFGEAESEILRALSDAPKNVQALNLLALVRYKLGRLEEAHATYREIAGAAPQDAHARRNLGLIALKLGHVEEALPELEMAVRLTPGDERAWSYLGYAYAKKGEVVEAAAAFRRAGPGRAGARAGARGDGPPPADAVAALFRSCRPLDGDASRRRSRGRRRAARRRPTSAPADRGRRWARTRWRRRCRRRWTRPRRALGSIDLPPRGRRRGGARDRGDAGAAAGVRAVAPRAGAGAGDPERRAAPDDRRRGARARRRRAGGRGQPRLAPGVPPVAGAPHDRAAGHATARASSG